MVAGSAFSGPALLQFPAVARAFARGDKAPLLRLAAEHRVPTAPDDRGDPSVFSLGDQLAVLCNEQRFPWAATAEHAERLAQWEAAFAALGPGSFGAFSPRAVSGDPRDPAPACLDWPAPASTEPPVPDGAKYPAVPALVMGGDLDDAVPADARAYAWQFPAGAYVEFPETVPVPAPCTVNTLFWYVALPICPTAPTSPSIQPLGSGYGVTTNLNAFVAFMLGAA